MAEATPPSVRVKATTYLGAVASDRAEYGRANDLLHQAVAASRELGEHRREAYGLSMLGRVSLLRGELDQAVEQLTVSIEVAQRDHWLSFLPWPQALLGQTWLSLGDLGAATAALEQSFARACQIGDPCWEGISARGLTMLADARGDSDSALAMLLDARARANRFADRYSWLDVHLLDALCELERKYDHPLTAQWATTMLDKASRTGMRELTVRAMLHEAATGVRGDAEAAALLAADIDNPLLAPPSHTGRHTLSRCRGVTGRTNSVRRAPKDTS